MSNSFMAQLDQPGQLLELFEFLPHVHLFVKDTQSRFVKVNACSLAMHGCKAMSEIIGKTDYDFHPPTLAAQYIAEDQQVMDSGKPLCNQVWLVLDHERTPRWYLSTKLPLFGRDGKAIGIGGVMRSFEHAGPSPRDYHRLTPVMEYVLANYSQHISLPDLAQCAHLSVSQLQREFKKLFSTSPGEYLLKVRLLSARRRLEETTDPLGVIAAECGFYDPSHFTRAFTAQIGMPPLAYRRRFQRPA
jgi:AraC-like DNA-binding protein